MADELRDRAIRGGAAKIVSQGIGFVLRIGGMMVLGRLLDPADFGLIGMITAITGVFTLLKEFGLSSAVIQRESVTPRQLSTVFWINVFVGALLTCVTAGLGPFLASFYHEPRLEAVASWLAVGFFLNGLGVQHSALMQRKMRFTAIAVIDTVSLLTSTAVGVGLALAGWGYWSLVYMNISVPLVQTACTWLVMRWIPGLPSRDAGIGDLMRYGGTVTVNGLVVYTGYNLEKVLLGRFWGAEAIGLYGRAYQLINIPTDNLNSAVGGVAFAALSRLQDEPVRFRSYFLKGYSLVLGLTVPVTIACATFSEDIIRVLLGPKWVAAAPLFRFLSPVILVFGIINPLGWILFACNLVGRSLRIGFVLAPVVLTGYLVGLSWGPKGVAFGYSAAMLLWLVPHVAWCVSGTPVSVRDVFSTVLRPLIASAIAVLVAALVESKVGAAWEPVTRLVLCVAVMFVLYFFILVFAMGQKSFYFNLAKGFAKRAPVV